jgi:Ran GTPase-activating protein (RanGAP) involved in mRNA processing and transport
VDLSGNSLADEAFLYLCGYIRGNQHLREINLNYSKFRDETPAKELAEALATCPRLERVSLKLCRIEDALVKHLA